MKRHLSDYDKNAIFDSINQKIEENHSAPRVFIDDLKRKTQRDISAQLDDVMVPPHLIDRFSTALVNRYTATLVEKGKPVGAIAGQSVSSGLTESTMKTHAAVDATMGRDVHSGVSAANDLLSLSKHPRDNHMKINIRRSVNKNGCLDIITGHDIRYYLSTIQTTHLHNITSNMSVIKYRQRTWHVIFREIYRDDKSFFSAGKPKYCIKLRMNKQEMYLRRITLHHVGNILRTISNTRTYPMWSICSDDIIILLDTSDMPNGHEDLYGYDIISSTYNAFLSRIHDMPIKGFEGITDVVPRVIMIGDIISYSNVVEMSRRRNIRLIVNFNIDRTIADEHGINEAQIKLAVNTTDAKVVDLNNNEKHNNKVTIDISKYAEHISIQSDEEDTSTHNDIIIQNAVATFLKLLTSQIQKPLSTYLKVVKEEKLSIDSVLLTNHGIYIDTVVDTLCNAGIIAFYNNIEDVINITYKDSMQNDTSELTKALKLNVNAPNLTAAREHWYGITVGCNYAKTIILPYVDHVHTTTSLPNEIFAVYGIIALREGLHRGVDGLLGGNANLHSASIVPNTMASKSIPIPMTRYGQKVLNPGMSSVIALEEALKNTIIYSSLGASDNISDPPGAILTGNMLSIGYNIVPSKTNAEYSKRVMSCADEYIKQYECMLPQ